MIDGQCIFVTGGSSLIPNFIPRLRNALTPVLPFRSPLKIVTSLDGGDPRYEAWRGMAQWSSTEQAKAARVTRQEYEEHGGEWLKEHAWGNPVAQTRVDM
jgi:actin-related protein 5